MLFNKGGSVIGATTKKAYALKYARRQRWRAAAPYLVSLLFFLAVCLTAPGSAKGAAVALSVLLLLSLVPRGGVLRERVTLPLLGLTALFLIGGVSCFYAVAGKLALREFLKLLSSLCLTLLLLAWAPKNDGPRWIATVLSCFTALAGFFSIDMLSTHIFSDGLKAFLGLFTPEYEVLGGLESGVRMTSVFENPNLFAGAVGLGVLLSLGLASTAEDARERAVYTALLYISSLAFVLAFSMGASGFIVAAFLVFLALERKGRRISLAVLMVETLVLVVLAAAVISAVAFDGWTGFQPIPLLCTLAGAAALCALDRFAGRRVAEKLAEHGKTTLILALCIVGALIAYVLAAVLWTGPVDLARGESLRRAAYPDAGAYTLELDADGPVTVTVQSQNRQETMMHTETVLYRGDADGAVFAVPEDSLVVYFNFYAPEGARVASASFGGYPIPLDYKLLPGFIANRLQGLFANENAIQRTVFFSDGLKLFARSPVFGLGLGAFGNGIKSVQSFYYVTNYAHNHYIQSLIETGLVGLLLFLALLAVSAAAIVFARRRAEFDPLLPALGAALVFMAGHAAVELVFSGFCYLPIAFGVFALIGLCCGGALPKPKLGKAARTGILAGSSAAVAVFGVLVVLNIAAANLVEREPTLDSLNQAIRLDQFEWADYMLGYVTSIEDPAATPEMIRQGDEYALRLAELDSNTIPYYLAEYYFYYGRYDEGVAMLEKYVDYVSSDPSTWEQTFQLLMEYAADEDSFRAGVVSIAERLEDWNARNMGEITLSEEARAFIARMRA